MADGPEPDISGKANQTLSVASLVYMGLAFGAVIVAVSLLVPSRVPAGVLVWSCIIGGIVLAVKRSRKAWFCLAAIVGMMLWLTVLAVIISLLHR